MPARNTYQSAVESARPFLLGEDIQDKDQDDFRSQVEQELIRSFPSLDSSSVSAAFEEAWSTLQYDPNDHQAD